MIIKSKGIVGGKIADKYGKRGTQFNEAGMCTYSLPVEIDEAPAKTKSYVIILEDRDAIPVCGFSWIHWTVANLTVDKLEENAAVSGKLLQGATSWISPLAGGIDRDVASIYGGPAPPNAPHTYRLAVYALDSLLDLKQGFYANELYRAMKGHVLDKKILEGSYSN